MSAPVTSIDRVQGRIRRVFRRRSESFKRVLVDNPEGADVLRHIRKICGVQKSSMTFGDSHATAHYEGRRFVALEIDRILHLSPEEIERLTEGETE